jgi:hypothetical protein
MPAEGLKLVTLYTWRLSRSRGAASSSSRALIASGMAMKGMVVSSRTKQA